jgi:hypothetical protein
MEIMKNQVEILEMKTSINQIQTTVDSIITRQERKSELDNKIEELLMQTIIN